MSRMPPSLSHSNNNNDMNSCSSTLQLLTAARAILSNQDDYVVERMIIWINFAMQTKKEFMAIRPSKYITWPIVVENLGHFRNYYTLHFT